MTTAAAVLWAIDVLGKTSCDCRLAAPATLSRVRYAHWPSRRTSQAMKTTKPRENGS